MKPKTFRLNATETKALNEQCLRINRDLVKMGKMPLKDTEVCHQIIEQTLIKGSIELSRNGELKIIAKSQI